MNFQEQIAVTHLVVVLSLKSKLLEIWNKELIFQKGIHDRLIWVELTR